MKLFYDLSNLKESTTFKHDAQLINGVQIGMIVFLILSSITVFSGVRSHLNDYLMESFFMWRWLVLGSSYFVGSLGIDLVNTVCLAYVVSAVLRKDFERESIVLIVFCSLLSLGLTYYSFSMSQNSALVIGNDVKEENKQDDTSELLRIDSTLNTQLANIEFTFLENHKLTIDPFQERISNISKTYDNQIAVLKNEIETIDKNTTKDNYLYAAKQKKPLTANIQDLEAAKLLSLSPVLSEQQRALDGLTSQKNQMIADAKDLHKTDRNRKQQKTDNYNDEVTASSTVFSDLFSKLSGYAIFALLLLTSIREVLYFRNDIEPEPILSNYDFSPSWIFEVVSYPFIWMRRHSVNRVREWYEALPELKQPVIQDKIYDGQSLDQSIVIFKADDKGNTTTRSNRPNAPGAMSGYMPPGQSRNLDTRDYHFASISVSGGNNSNESKNQVSQYSHETPNFDGLENVLEVEEPTKSETHETEVKIKHIGKNEKEYWYDKKQVEGKVKKYTSNVRDWQKKVKRKKSTQRDRDALENNEGLLIYWKERLKEFK